MEGSRVTLEPFAFQGASSAFLGLLSLPRPWARGAVPPRTLALDRFVVEEGASLALRRGKHDL